MEFSFSNNYEISLQSCFHHETIIMDTIFPLNATITISSKWMQIVYLVYEQRNEGKFSTLIWSYGLYGNIVARKFKHWIISNKISSFFFSLSILRFLFLLLEQKKKVSNDLKSRSNLNKFAMSAFCVDNFQATVIFFFSVEVLWETENIFISS